MKLEEKQLRHPEIDAFSLTPIERAAAASGVALSPNAVVSRAICWPAAGRIVRA